MSQTLAVRVIVYCFLYLAGVYFLGGPLTALGQQLFGATTATALAALIANSISLKIFEPRPLSDIGIAPTRAGGRNLAIGCLMGLATAMLVILPALGTGLASLKPAVGPTPAGAAWITVLLAIGSAGEEVAFHGYGFQILLRSAGLATVILPTGALFALLHGGNPDSTPLALVNTAIFGALFGWAFVRSRDLWFPIGLHYGWNLALPLFGVNVSGYTMRLTAVSLEWNADPLVSGGGYGIEGSILASAALVAMAIGIARAPVTPQRAPLAERPDEG